MFLLLGIFVVFGMLIVLLFFGFLKLGKLNLIVFNLVVVKVVKWSKFRRVDIKCKKLLLICILKLI